MKIGINVSFLAKPMTGIGQVTKEFLKTLAEHPDFKHHQWYLYTDGVLAPTEKPLALPANCTRREVRTWWPRQDIPHQYWFEKYSLPHALQADVLDVFLSLYQSATILPPGIRHVMLVHDLIPKLFPEYLEKWSSQFHYRAVLTAIQQATLLLTPSEATKQDLVREVVRTPATIESIPLGVNQQFWQKFDAKTLRHRLGLYQLEPGYLYHGGGLELRKNTETVLRAYRQLLDARGTTLPPLVISGKVYAATNALATPVKGLIQELQLEGRVKLLGLVPSADLPVIYQGAKLFLFPSSYEGFGLPVVEAYASGVPVITTEAGALKALVSEGEALMVPPGESQALAQAMASLLDDPSLAAALVAKGSVTAGRHTWSAFAEGVLRALIY